MKRLLTLTFCAVLLLTGCSIKVTKTMMKAILKASMKIPENTVAQDYEGRIDVPYVEVGNPAQMLDIFYAPADVRKDAALVDFHGGFYVAGQKEGNRAFASAFLKEGFDVVLVSYRLNDGTLDVSDELADCAAAADYVTVHAGELGLNKDRMFVTGDSAGGHLALYIAEGSEDHSLPVHPEHFAPLGALLNCPAYDFAAYSDAEMYARSFKEWFLGPRYEDREWMKAMSPRTHLGSYSGPLFVSTCTNDFIRGESLKLKADCEAAGRPITFVDIESDDKKVAHVHNVTSIDLPESRTVNAAMVEFMNACL
ncbi:MAG: alpha/beta hydrolase [Bacteroidales bacterium]|nr:alpha/beta hydrolase [Bacteroidales bacterium]